MALEEFQIALIFLLGFMVGFIAGQLKVLLLEKHVIKKQKKTE